MIHVVIPLKNLGHAKSRLANDLSPSQRSSLMVAMASDVLTCIRDSAYVDGISVVVGCPLGASLCRKFGVNYVCELELKGLSINERLHNWSRERFSKSTAKFVLIVQADLPLLTTSVLDAFLSLAKARKVLISPDQHGTGTSLLMVPAPGIGAFNYGDRSAYAHARLASLAGLDYEFIDFGAATNDVDTLEDIQFVSSYRSRGSVRSRYTTAFLVDHPCVAQPVQTTQRCQHLSKNEAFARGIGH